MALSKQNLDNFLPNGFETENKEGYKANFSDDKIATGYEKDVADIIRGPNLNNLLDKIGKNFNVLDGVNKYLNNMPINSIPTVNANNQLDYVDNNFLNKTQITNCILEAPNGVATYSGNTITVKQGLKVLIPNGRNADGTLKNIEYIIQSDITLSGIPFGDKHIISVDTNGVIGIPLYKNVLYSDEIPSTRPSELTYIYSEKENKWYIGTPSKDFAHSELTLIGYLVENGTTITELKTYNPINILKQSDKSEISGWGMPSNKYIDLSLGTSGSPYTAPANGWFTLAKYASSNGQFLQVALQNSIGHRTYAPTGGDLWITSEPVQKGQSATISYTASGNVILFRFYYAQGEV